MELITKYSAPQRLFPLLCPLLVNLILPLKLMSVYMQQQVKLVSLHSTCNGYSLLLGVSWIVLIPCSLFHFYPRIPHYLCIVDQLNDFFMAGQADLSTCIQVTVFFPLGVCLAHRKQNNNNNNNKNNKKHNINYETSRVIFFQLRTMTFVILRASKWQDRLISLTSFHLGCSYI